MSYISRYNYTFLNERNLGSSNINCSIYYRNFFIAIENCTCVGVKNVYGDGDKCKKYIGYENENLNSVWCYAETTTCQDASGNRLVNSVVQNGRYGASRKACLNYSGKFS